jgi:hypothetical protein
MSMKAIFPRISAGLPELNKIAIGVLKRTVGFGTTLFFACRLKKNYSMTNKEKAAIEQWISTYID